MPVAKSLTPKEAAKKILSILERLSSDGERSKVLEAVNALSEATAHNGHHAADQRQQSFAE